MRIVLFANTDWYLWNFRRSLALALLAAGHEVVLLSPEGPFAKRLQDMGFAWHAVPMSRASLNPFREAILLAWLVRFFRNVKPTLVHGFTIKCAVYGSLAARVSGVPFRVNAVAGMGYVFTNDSLKARLLRPFVRCLFRLAFGGSRARLILQNEDDVLLFDRAKLLTRARIKLIPGSGVDCDLFHPGDRSSAKHHKIRVLLAARLLWDKGLREYVFASNLLRRKGVDVEFLLAGVPDPGNPSSVSEEVVRGWESEGAVRWLGHVEDMAALLRSVDIVTLPSHREGLPKSLVEAGASGCALIASDVPGCRDVVQNGVDGLLVPVKDAIALADAIEHLCKRADLRDRLSVAARAKAMKFGEQVVIDKTIKVYEELV